MKLNKKSILCEIILIFLLTFSGITYAESEVETIEVNDEQLFDSEARLENADDDGGLQYLKVESVKDELKFVSKIKTLMANVGASLPSSYRTTGLTVKNQESTKECWAFSFTSAVEAYNKVHGLTSNVYSPRHVDYSCSNSFIESVKDNYFNRKVNDYGTLNLVAAYASSLKGPVLESDMPFSSSTPNISLNDINKVVQQQVTGIKYFNNIYKKYNSSGVLEYYSDSNYLNKMSDNEVASIRRDIKTQIQTNGSVIALIYGDNNKDVMITDSSKKVNHAVLIVGWNDTYKASSWKNAGAYIVMNSYGTNLYDNGYCYVSYDDLLVENSLVAITGVKDNGSYKTYEYDQLGSIGTVHGSTFKDLGYSDTEEMSGINIYNRDTSKTEVLKEIGITNLSYQYVEVYYSDEFALSQKNVEYPVNFKKISKASDENRILDVGYHVLELSEPITLTKGKFAICVKFKQANTSKVATVAVESGSGNSNWYDNVTGEVGESYYSPDFKESGYDTHYISLNSTIHSGSSNEKKYYVNAGIKAFTTEKGGTTPTPTPSPTPTPTPTPSPSPTPTPTPVSDVKITSSKYTVNNSIISRVSPNTGINEFKNNITVNKTYTIVDSSGNNVSTGIIKSGYKIKVDSVLYEISVIGDLNGDGLIMGSDLAIMRYYLVGKKGYELTGVYYYAADLSNDGNVTGRDLAQIRLVLVNKLHF